mmetsp:Transcript_51100/g.143881  ORF Transcript_51100/g.143881 Transcript_51100/m.143881 type:complete len:371 (-) Transcript_51100:782-1894(-)
MPFGMERLLLIECPDLPDGVQLEAADGRLAPEHLPGRPVPREEARAGVQDRPPRAPDARAGVLDPEEARPGRGGQRPQRAEPAPRQLGVLGVQPEPPPAALLVEAPLELDVPQLERRGARLGHAPGLERRERRRHRHDLGAGEDDVAPHVLVLLHVLRALLVAEYQPGGAYLHPYTLPVGARGLRVSLEQPRGRRRTLGRHDLGQLGVPLDVALPPGLLPRPPPHHAEHVVGRRGDLEPGLPPPGQRLGPIRRLACRRHSGGQVRHSTRRRRRGLCRHHRLAGLRGRARLPAVGLRVLAALLLEELRVGAQRLDGGLGVGQVDAHRRVEVLELSIQAGGRDSCLLVQKSHDHKVQAVKARERALRGLELA